MTVFLGGKDGAGNLHYRATAFCVAMPSARWPFGSPCLVTAKHNVIRATQTYGNVYIRMNIPDREAVDVEVADSWTFADAPACDIAAVPFPFLMESRIRVPPIPARWLVTPDVIEARKIGAGDRLVVMGLFSNHIGKQRNLPIVRSGNLASMPLEPLGDPMTGDTYDAYLAEIRSVGGLSGSPVFVMLHPPRFIRDDDASAGQHFYLLGLVRGHWHQPVEAGFADKPVESDMQQLNTGIAIVTPIAELFSIFDTQRFIDYRAEMEQKLDASQSLPE